MRALPLLLALLLALPASALDLMPTTLQLPAGGRTELWLFNPGPGHWQGQVQVWVWAQQLDGEHLQRSAQVLASPTLLDLPSGARQRVWLLPGSAASATGEQAFRILLVADDRQQPRYSLPLFLGGPQGPSRPQLHATVQIESSQTYLRLDNAGPLHARLSELVHVAAEGRRTVLMPGLAGYVLAGQQRRWALPARREGYGSGHFRARLQDGEEIILAAPSPAIAGSKPSGL